LFYWDAVGVSAVEAHESDTVGVRVCQRGRPEIPLSAVATIFQEVVFDYDAMARLIMQLFDFQEKSYYLTLVHILAQPEHLF
jgi:hypothetical protein